MASQPKKRVGPLSGGNSSEQLAGPVASVSLRSGGGNAGPAQTTLSAAPPTVRVPATRQEPQEHTTHSKRGRSRPWGRAGGGRMEDGGGPCGMIMGGPVGQGQEGLVLVYT
uniref:Uncharacterized protein n=1 Tax=Peromyscus maniculatus bairdii TaxID=230844 RepID=A0A8C8UEC2_PERMB